MGPHGHGWGPRRGRGPRGRGRPAEPPVATSAEVVGWLVGRLPDDWFTAEPKVIIDRDEITVIGAIEAPTAGGDVDAAAAAEGRIKRFREETRGQRMEIADEAERRFERKVAWGVEVDGNVELFTTLAVPAMTRLRQPERQVLDTLVDAGVARSRAEALAWCVHLVGEHEEDWIASLRSALDDVQKAREAGPS